MCLQPVIDQLSTAQRITVLTGAGISAESGVPTFRGEKGLWKTYRPEELANFNAFSQNPKLVWEWYNWRRKLISEVQPNPGHFALAKIESLVPHFTLITQNVDGLHQKAGSRNILELHGNIMRSRCSACNRYSDRIEMDVKDHLPLCQCGGMTRPDVVWFGEMLPQETITQAFQETELCDFFFTIGTSAVVQPAASLPLIARKAGAYVVEINVERTVISEHIDISIQGASGEILPDIVSRVWGETI